MGDAKHAANGGDTDNALDLQQRSGGGLHTRTALTAGSSGGGRRTPQKSPKSGHGAGRMTSRRRRQKATRPWKWIRRWRRLSGCRSSLNNFSGAFTKTLLLPRNHDGDAWRSFRSRSFGDVSALWWSLFFPCCLCFLVGRYEVFLLVLRLWARTTVRASRPRHCDQSFLLRAFVKMLCQSVDVVM